MANKQNTSGQRAYKQQTCISHGPGGWKSKMKVPTDLVSGEGPLPGSQMVILSLQDHMVEEA